MTLLAGNVGNVGMALATEIEIEDVSDAIVNKVGGVERGGRK